MMVTLVAGCGHAVCLNLAGGSVDVDLLGLEGSLDAGIVGEGAPQDAVEIGDVWDVVVGVPLHVDAVPGIGSAGQERP